MCFGEARRRVVCGSGGGVGVGVGNYSAGSLSLSLHKPCLSSRWDRIKAKRHSLWTLPKYQSCPNKLNIIPAENISLQNENKPG